MMEATCAVRHDHELLRKKLALLESSLQMAPESRFVVRELCFSLQRLLQEHMHREARALQIYHQRMPSGSGPSQGKDHTPVHHLLRTVNELLLSGMRASTPALILRLSQVIEQLEAQMDEQERTVFQFLDHAEASRADEAQTAISGTMSVNEVLQRYPETGRFFERLHVNRLREGYDSVDEFAWYHGMDVSQFLEQLRQVVTSFPSTTERRNP